MFRLLNICFSISKITFAYLEKIDISKKMNELIFTVFASIFYYIRAIEKIRQI